MRQLALDIRPAQAPTLADFIAGDNAELLARLTELAAPRSYDALYLWGEPGSGRSHLLRATCAAATAAGRPACYVDGADAGDDLPLPRAGVLLLDDVERLGEAAQIALFRAINTAPMIGLAMALAGPAPPRQLALREDLRTRIGAMLAFQVRPLDEAHTVAALSGHARARGFELDADVLRYLMTHGRRDLGSLLAALERIDHLSLELKRRITVPLLREILAETDPLLRP